MAPQALLDFPALLDCIYVAAESFPVDVSCSSVREASEKYKVLPVAPNMMMGDAYKELVITYRNCC